MIEVKSYANYKNVSSEVIAQLEHQIRWFLGGNAYDNCFQIVQFLDNKFPKETYIVYPIIDNNTKKIFCQKV